VRNAVQNGIENLSGTNVSVNANPQDSYRFRARTAEELKATQHLVPVVRREDLPLDDDATHTEIARQREWVRDIVSSPQAPKGWIL
jgi:hypothetical protein